MKPRHLFVAILLLLSALCSRQQIRAQEGPKASPGLGVGANAPSFTLQDQNGQEHGLSEFLKKGKVALVFYLSADWWPYCQQQLVELQSNLKELQATGVQIVAISYDSVTVLKRFADKRGISFPLLSDVGSKTIEAYGIRNKEAPERVQGIPYPGTFILDQAGLIRAKLFYEGYKKRHDSADIMRAAKDVH